MHGFKKNVVTIGGVIILILSVITFVFIPGVSGTGMGNGGKVILGKWKNKGLEYTSDGLFMQHYRRLYHNAEQRGDFKTENTFEQEFKMHQIQYTAFNAAMVQLAAQQEVLGAGFQLPNSKINKALIPFYSDETGTYSRKLYEETSEHEKLLRRREVTAYLTSQQYFDDLFGSGSVEMPGVKVSSEETAFIKKMVEKQRTFKYVVFEESQYPQDKIALYGKEHADLFAEHHYQMLTFTAEDEAKKILTALEKNELTFEDAVVTNSTKQGTDSSGKMNPSYRTNVNQLFPESTALETVLKLEAGTLSSVVKTAYGYAIVKCTAPVTPADFTDSAVLDRVFSYMKSNDRGLIEDYLEEKAKIFAENVRQAGVADGFEAMIEKEGLVLQTSNPIAVNYGNINPLPQISAQSDSFLASGVRNELFFKTLFALKPAEISEPLLLGSNVLVFVLDSDTDTDEETMNTIGTLYPQLAGYWYYDYPSALFNFQQLPWGQQTFIDFVLKSKHFTNNFNEALKS